MNPEAFSFHFCDEDGNRTPSTKPTPREQPYPRGTQSAVNIILDLCTHRSISQGNHWRKGKSWSMIALPTRCTTL